MERIIHAAILRNNIIVFDRDHARCFGRLALIFPPDHKSIQGFLTNQMRFVNREVAADIAFQAGQIPKWEPGQSILSEELWCPRSGGKHDYDEKEGYVLREKDL